MTKSLAYIGVVGVVVGLLFTTCVSSAWSMELLTDEEMQDSIGACGFIGVCDGLNDCYTWCHYDSFYHLYVTLYVSGFYKCDWLGGIDWCSNDKTMHCSGMTYTAMADCQNQRNPYGPCTATKSCCGGSAYCY